MFKNINPEQIAFWLKKHLKKILFVFSLMTLLALAFIGWSEWRKKEETKIQNSLYEYQEALNKLRERIEVDKKNTLDFLIESDEKKFVPTEEMKKKADLYERAITQHQSYQASAVFAIDLADFYYEYGEIEKAKELLLLFAFPKKASNIYHLASFQLASYYMDEKDCEKALALLEALSLNEKAEYMHLESHLQQALCLEHLKHYEQALRKYEDILNKDPEGYTGRLARDYKKILILNKNSARKEK